MNSSLHIPCSKNYLLFLFSLQVMSDSLLPCGLKHTSLFCPLLSLEFAKTHVHWFNDAIQPSHLLLPTSPTAFCLSQHQGLFQWIGSSHHVAKFLELQLQHQSFQWTFKVDLLWDWFIWSLRSPRDSQESSPIPQFNSINSSALSLLYGPTLTYVHDYWENHSFNSTLFWGWPESSFQFSLRYYGISRTNFLANSMN